MTSVMPDSSMGQPDMLQDLDHSNALLRRTDSFGGRHSPSPFFMIAVTACLLLCVLPYEMAAQQKRPAQEQVQVVNPNRLDPSHLEVTRVPVGIAQDYKSCLARLPSGELLLVGFQTTGGVPKEYCFDRKLVWRDVPGGSFSHGRRPPVYLCGSFRGSAEDTACGPAGRARLADKRRIPIRFRS